MERPASVVKELVENSVYAGATRIHVEVSDGGKTLIRVSDNGCGMTAQEAVLALQRHATSKISRAEDLGVVRTLGFRGEALPSVASVSRVSVVTRARGEVEGVRLSADGGEIRELEPAGAAEGSVITIQDLFYNTPARLKFLRTTRSELSQICDVLTRLALSHPEISVRLTADGEPTLQAPGTSDPLNTITALFGKEVARELVSVSHSVPSYTVEGHVSRPNYNRPTRGGQHFFVNGRAVRSRTLTHALDEAYRSTMPSGRHSFAVIHLELDPALVDVNVHPAKAEVRFLRDWEVHRVAFEAVRQAIGRPEPGREPLARRETLPPEALQGSWLQAPAPSPEGDPPSPAPLPDPNDPFADIHPPPGASERGPGRAPAAAGPSSAVISGGPADAPLDWPAGLEPPPEPPHAPPTPPRPAAVSLPLDLPPPDPASLRAPDSQLRLPDLPAPQKRFRPLAQLWNSYLVAEGTEGVWVVDQHLAHERVIFDDLAAERQEQPVPARPLPAPLTVQLSPAEARLAPTWLPFLERAGFSLEEFGGDAFVLRSAPVAVPSGRELVILRQVLDDLFDGSRAGGGRPDPFERVAASTACRAALKKGTPLAEEEQERLLRDLEKTTNPYTCPHGCPIAVQISYQELLRRFKRT